MLTKSTDGTKFYDLKSRHICLDSFSRQGEILEVRVSQHNWPLRKDDPLYNGLEASEAYGDMVDRKSIRNVLDEVLSSEDEKNIPGIEALSTLINRRLPSGKATQRIIADNFIILDDDDDVLSETEEQAKIRKSATHMLLEETLEDLGAARKRLGDMLANKIEYGVTRSEIVDQALQIVLEEFQDKGLDSTLVQKILKVSDKNS